MWCLVKFGNFGLLLYLENSEVFTVISFAYFACCLFSLDLITSVNQTIHKNLLKLSVYFVVERITMQHFSPKQIEVRTVFYSEIEQHVRHLINYRVMTSNTWTNCLHYWQDITKASCSMRNYISIVIFNHML